jgi:membrane fusion protein, multidrug efflux system
VQLVASGKVLHQSVQLGARGTSGLQNVVAVTGLANEAVVINGNVGALREGASVKFTQLNLGSASAPASASKSAAP